MCRGAFVTQSTQADISMWPPMHAILGKKNREYGCLGF